MAITPNQAKENIIMANETKTVRFFKDSYALAKELLDLSGHKFMQLKTCIAQDAKMNKTDNPFMGKNVTKLSDTQVTVQFKSYDAKVEKRDGEKSESKGNWQTAFMQNGNVTVFAIHKGDVKTVLTTDRENAKLDKAGEISDCFGNHRAVLDENGDTILTTDEPRLYIRAEVVRDGGDQPRQDRKMRTKSIFLDTDGNKIEKTEIKPFIKKSKPRTDETDFQTFSLDNIVEVSADGMIYRRMNSKVIIERMEKLELQTV